MERARPSGVPRGHVSPNSNRAGGAEPARRVRVQPGTSRALPELSGDAGLAGTRVPAEVWRVVDQAMELIVRAIKSRQQA